MEGVLMRVLLFVCLFQVIFCKSVEKPIQLTEDNWRDILEGEWMVEFMAPWCPACRSFTETWEKFAKWSNDLDVKVGVIDVTENPGLSGRFFVTALPTIYHVQEGTFRQYHGSRQENDLISYIDEKKWYDVEPISAWFYPNSIQMSTVSLFFKAAMVIRSFYTTMTTDYGIPEWGCYLIFAILTIITGLILGLLIVCCCDVFFPPKYQTMVVREEARESEEADGEDEDNKEEDIVDDTKTEEDTSTARKRRPKKAE